MIWHEERLKLSKARAQDALCGLPGACQFRDEEKLYLGAFPSAFHRGLLPPGHEGCPSQLSTQQQKWSHWPSWVGVLPYEHFRELERGYHPSADKRPLPHLSEPLWQRYDALAQQLARDEFLVGGLSLAAVERLVRALSRATSGSRRQAARVSLGAPLEPEAVHRARVRGALDEIAQGRLYQVNLARRLDFSVQGDAFSLLEALDETTQAPYAAVLTIGDRIVVSTSPELFLSVEPEGLVRTRPIKGTRPRDADPTLDRQLAAELAESEKEKAELAMVIDIERNDLGRLAIPGTVRLARAPHVVAYPTIFHREAEVEARLRPKVTFSELLLHTMPSGSITGAPKESAMRLIARLEKYRRGLYTGALGYFSCSGHLRLSMAIRVLTVVGGQGHYFSGGGIVSDSDPQAEVEETDWKAAQVRHLLSAR